MIENGLINEDFQKDPVELKVFSFTHRYKQL